MELKKLKRGETCLLQGAASGCPVLHSYVRERTRSEIRHGTIGMNANVWKWRVGSV